jgi:hypothetical protein
MEKEIKILCGLLENMQQEQRVRLIEAAKITHSFLWHLEQYGEIDKNKVYRLVKKNNPLVKEIAKNLKLKEIKRKSSPIARRMGKVWVRK